MFTRYLSRLLLASAAAFILSTTAHAAPTDYFSSFGGGIDNIGKYPATPSSWGTEFATGNDPHSLTVAGDDLYWVQGNNIYVQNVNSGPKSLFQSFGVAPIDFTVDKTNGSYYASFGGGIDNIGKYPLTPSAWGTEFATGNDTHGLTLAGGNLYWLEGNNIWMQDVNSSSKTLLQSFGVAPIDLAVDALNDFYYASFGDGIDNIGKYPLELNSWGTEIATGNDPHGLNIIDGKVYWLEGNYIWMANLDGTGKTLFQQFGIAPLSLALYSPVVVVDPNPPPLPEPASIALVGLGFAALGLTHRQSKARQLN
jgi:hypothetical protein